MITPCDRCRTFFLINSVKKLTSKTAPKIRVSRFYYKEPYDLISTSTADHLL